MPLANHAIATIAVTAALAAQSPDWYRLSPLGGDQELVFDTARERAVLFESHGYARSSRTFEWVGQHWSLRRTGTSPPPRHGFALGHDPLRQRVVVFGGHTTWDHRHPGSLLADTWEYDGADWSLRTLATNPPPQTGAFLPFDHATGRLLLCCGTSYPGAAGAFHYDGASWTAAPTPPFPAWPACVASDRGRARIVAIGHGTIWGQTTVTTTFEWDGATWTQMAPAQSPPPRYGNHLVFTAQRAATVLHGGYSITSPYAPATDLWQWDGTNWTTIAAAQVPVRLPIAVVDDPVRSTTLLLGARTTGATSHTVAWDGTTWTFHDELEPPPADPAGTYFDGNRGTVVGFTQQGTSFVEWNGIRWRSQPLPPNGGAWPITFDAARQRAVGIRWTLGQPNATVEWDGVGWNQWAVPTPPARSLVFHAARGTVMAVTPAGISEWNGSVWTLVGGPAPMVYTDALAYDAANVRLVAVRAGVQTLVEVATWDGTSWTMHAPAVRPPSRIDFALAWDGVRQRVVLFGGYDRTVGSAPFGSYRNFADLWEWDGAAWTQRLLAQAPPERTNAAMVGDPTRQRMLLFGGRRLEPSTSIEFRDTWILDATPAASVAVLGPGCAGPQGAVGIVAAEPRAGAVSFSIDVHAPVGALPTLFLFALANAQATLGSGCTSFVPVPDAIAFTIANASGFASQIAALPASVQGAAFSAQAAVLDATSPLGFATTPGLRIVVGR